MRAPSRSLALVACLALIASACAPTPAPLQSTPTPEGTVVAPSPTSTLAATASPAVTTEPTPGVTADASGAVPLAVLLALLRVAPEDRTGYDRSLFIHWIDADGDGCDTRKEVLIEEAFTPPTIGTGCTLTGGTWFSAYDGVLVAGASGIQIDHVVALAEAWDSGASGWTQDRRKAFANDLDVPWALIAVSSSSNQSKSDKDPADWLPPNAGDECPFISAWIAQKVRWDLAVDQREHDALAGDIADCPDSRMPDVPAPPFVPGPTAMPGPTAGPAPSSRAGCDPAYPTVCIPPPPPDLDCGQISFRNFVVLAPDPHRFDGDHDGIGCET